MPRSCLSSTQALHTLTQHNKLKRQLCDYPDSFGKDPREASAPRDLAKLPLVPVGMFKEVQQALELPAGSA